MSRGVAYSINNANSERARNILRQLGHHRRTYPTRHPATNEAIAIIHTTRAATNTFPSTFKIHFFNVPACHSGCAVFQADNEASACVLSQSKLVIHQDGDLRLSGRSPEFDSPHPLLELEINHHELWFSLEVECERSHDIMVPTPELEFTLPRYDIPGDLGVVGRRISIIDENKQLIGDGIVGWCQ